MMRTDALDLQSPPTYDTWYQVSGVHRDLCELWAGGVYLFRNLCPIFCYLAISYNTLILKTGNGVFSTFAGVLDPGNGRIGPAQLKVRLAFLRDASNDVCPFLRRGVFIFADTPWFHRNQIRTLFIQKIGLRPIFRMKLRYIYETSFAIFL